MPEAEQVLRSAYRAFNARDIESAIELMDPEVDWPNAWEGGRVVGRAAARDYCKRPALAPTTPIVGVTIFARETARKASVCQINDVTSTQPAERIGERSPLQKTPPMWSCLTFANHDPLCSCEWST